MKIFLACPAPPHSRKGNRVTAVRWANLLKDRGHRLTIGQAYKGGHDLLIALHARKSYAAVRSYGRFHPAGPLTVALSGTALSRGIRTSRPTQRSLVCAYRFVLLDAGAEK